MRRPCPTTSRGRAGEIARRHRPPRRDDYLAVIVDGVECTRLASGANFGEIARLHDVARTATVRAMTRTRLFVIFGRDYLAAVMVREDGQTTVHRCRRTSSPTTSAPRPRPSE